MIGRVPFRRRVAQNRATTSVEFALVGGITIFTTFGSLDLGLLLWQQNAFQSAVAMAARCAAVGSTLCTDVKAYTVKLANDWTIANLVSSGNVTVTAVTTCNTQAGNFQKVTITSSLLGSALPWPFPNQTLTISSCYPTS